MKIIVCNNMEENLIVSVETMEHIRGKKKTETNVENAVVEFNIRHPNIQYSILECNDEVAEAVRFILGVAEYRKAHSLHDVFYELNSIRSDVSELIGVARGLQLSLTDTMDDVERKMQAIDECSDFEDELERFAYFLPHSATGGSPKGVDCKSVEARIQYGVHHAWGYEEVREIARHFLKMKGGEE